MIRGLKTSTIIAYQVFPEGSVGSAAKLHTFICSEGQNDHWKSVFEASKDPTFLLVALLSYGILAWDKAFTLSYLRITTIVSSSVMKC